MFQEHGNLWWIPRAPGEADRVRSVFGSRDWPAQTAMWALLLFGMSTRHVAGVSAHKPGAVPALSHRALVRVPWANKAAQGLHLRANPGDGGAGTGWGQEWTLWLLPSNLFQDRYLLLLLWLWLHQLQKLLYSTSLPEKPGLQHKEDGFPVFHDM